MFLIRVKEGRVELWVIADAQARKNAGISEVFDFCARRGESLIGPETVHLDFLIGWFLGVC